MKLKKYYIYTLSAVLITVLGVMINLPVKAAENQETKDVWAWTKKNLKSTWMEWGEKYWPTKPVRGGYFRRAARKYVGLLNPNHWPVNDWGVINLFYEGIQAYNGEYRQTAPWLIESWEFLDPTTLIMKLKPGVKFHDGTDFNAESLKYLFDWIGDKKNGCWTKGQQRIFRSLEVLGEYTLRWRTHKPWGNFPAGFFSFQISIKALKGDVAIREAKSLAKKLKNVEKRFAKLEKKAKKAAAKGGEASEKAAKKVAKARKALEKLREGASKAAEKAKDHKSTDLFPVGTGPFMYEEARPGNYIKAKRNPNWWFGKSIGRPEMPYFDGMKVIVIPDPSIQLANLRASKIDQINLNKSQYKMIKNDPNFNVYVHPMNILVYLIVNHAKGPCKDIRVRKAIAHAIDRKALIAGTQFGLAREASCFYPGDHWAHNPDLKPVSYDPELSKKLLAETGYEKGMTMAGTTGNDTNSRAITAAIKNMLAEVGINWKTDALDTVAITDRWKNLEFDVSLSAWPYIQDPFVLSKLYHPAGAWNFGRVHNEKVIPLLEAGQEEIDQKKRQKIYHEIEEIIYNSYEDIWLWWEVTAVAYRKNVQGWNNKMYIENRTWYQYSHPLWFKDGHP